jgi:hypothetical protein
MAQQRFATFLAEAEKGLELLGKHPNRDALRDEVNKLRELSRQASDAATTDGKMAELADEGRDLLRFFDACVKSADHQARRKDASPEKIQKAIDWACDQNARPLRPLIEQLRKESAEVEAKKEQ